jgi:hypothetical protein
MVFKNIFNLDSLKQNIKLDNSDYDFVVFLEEVNPEDQKVNDEKYSNEWNQEYELIYSSYVLEK